MINEKNFQSNAERFFIDKFNPTEIPKLLKDIRCQNGETYFLYEIEGKEQWLNHFQLKELRIELPFKFKSEAQKRDEIKREKSVLVLNRYPEDEIIQDTLDSFSIIMNQLRIQEYKI